MLLVPPALATIWLPPLVDAESRSAALAGLLAWPVLAAGVSLRLWSTLHIGGHKRQRVVMDGPYSICRNPLYLFSLLATLGVGLGSCTLAFPAIAMRRGQAVGRQAMPPAR